MAERTLNGAQRQQLAFARNARLEAKRDADAARWRKAKRVGFPSQVLNASTGKLYWWVAANNDGVEYRSAEAAIDACPCHRKDS